MSGCILSICKHGDFTTSLTKLYSKTGMVKRIFLTIKWYFLSELVSIATFPVTEHQQSDRSQKSLTSSSSLPS